MKLPASIYEIILISATILLVVLSIAIFFKSRSLFKQNDEMLITNAVLIDELERMDENQKELIKRYSELHGAYEYLDEKYEFYIRKNR